MVTIEEKIKSDISINDMRDGQIGVITRWGNHDEYLGRVVQRYGDSLITLGQCYGRGFYRPIGIESANEGKLRVQILENGTLLRLEDNE